MESDDGLRLATLAMRVGLLRSEQFDELQREIRTDADATPFLIARGWLAAGDVELLRQLLSRFNEKYPNVDWQEATDVPAEESQGWDVTPPPPPLLPGVSTTPPPKHDGTVTEPHPVPEGAVVTNNRRYRIRRLHAAGGIGRVWIADDETLGRQVALKDLRPEMGHPSHQLRFVDEAKITARLEHPGIVPVYELARRSEDGQPYYVMRFVKGRTLQDAIQSYHQARQSKRAEPVEFLHLLQAFRVVCQTVAYAHAHGVLHRDLKPPNILLGEFGEVLVLDWGLAKTGSAEPDSGSEGGADTLRLSGSATRAGQVLGTPSYMSPEQAAGKTDAIDARSDVWGLGAILYEILTGVPPFRGTTLDELLQRIKESPVVKPRALNADVPKALDAVCVKALAKDPEQRYASATELADEIQRWLADEPVRARPEPWTQRLARCARRHRTLVTTASALLVMAVAALTVSTFLINQQRSRAEANLQKALEAVETYYVQVSENRLLDEPGMQPLRADLLHDAERFCEAFARENEDDPRRQADLARVQLLLGRILGQTDEPKRARSALESARTQYASLGAQSPDADEYLRGEALAELSLGVLLFQTDVTQAKQMFEAAMEKYRRLTERSSARLEDWEKLGLAYNNLGQLHLQQKQFNAARALFEKAIANAEKRIEMAPDSRWPQHDLAGFYSNMGDAMIMQQKLADARPFYEKCLAIRQRLASHQAKDLFLDEHQASIQRSLGQLCMREKKLADAEKHMREAVRLRNLVVLRNPTVRRYRESLAQDHNAWARSLAALARPADAEREFALGIQLQSALQKELPDDANTAAKLGLLYQNRGYFQYDLDRNKDAIVSFSDAIRWLEMGRKLDGTLPYIRGELLNTYWTRAMAHKDLGNLKLAVQDYDRALELDDGSQRKTLEEERKNALGGAKDNR